ncbi:MAG TPA: NADH-quinone oxidoreductase subunit C, partial [Chitinophagaceae bacterium]
MALTYDLIKQRLTEQFGERITNFEEPYGMLTFEVPADLNIEALRFLYDDEELAFRFMTDLTAVHYPAYAGRELAVV